VTNKNKTLKYIDSFILFMKHRPVSYNIRDNLGM